MKLKTIFKKHQTTSIRLGEPIIRTLAEAVAYDGSIVKTDGVLLSNATAIAEMCGASVRNLDSLGRTAKACSVIAEQLDREAAVLRLRNCKGDTPVKVGLAEYALWGATTAALWTAQGEDRRIDSDEAGAVFALALICGMTVAISVDRDDVSTKTIAKAISVAVSEFAHDDRYSRCQSDHISICACGALYDVSIVAGDQCGLTGVNDATISKLVSGFNAGITIPGGRQSTAIGLTDLENEATIPEASQELQNKIAAMIQEKHAKTEKAAQQASGIDEPATRVTPKVPDIVTAPEPDFFGLRTDEPFADFFKNYPTNADNAMPEKITAVVVQPDSTFDDEDGDETKKPSSFFTRARSAAHRKAKQSQKTYKSSNDAPGSTMADFDMPLPGDPFIPASRPQRAPSLATPAPKKFNHDQGAEETPKEKKLIFDFKRIYDQGAEEVPEEKKPIFDFGRIYDQGAE